MYTEKEVYSSTLEYFSGDTLATKAWMDKYCLKNNKGEYLELNPNDMHRRLAKEFARIEKKYPNPMSEETIFSLLKDFEYIIPQGSPMYGIGNNNFITSLSNCFVIGSNQDSDSYGSIMRTDEEQVQLMKRRGGVGHDMSHLRPSGSLANNSALGANAGSILYMNRYSNSTREVSQDGRRGALMLSMSIAHPDAEKFIDMKLDTTKVTGANVSVKITDEFIKAVKFDKDFIQRFPIDQDLRSFPSFIDTSYDELKSWGGGVYTRRIKARKLWDKIVNNAWKSAEPGVLFWDRIIEESPADCYGESWKTVSTNPCFTGDTIIAVADGRNGVTIKQLAEESESFPVYSARVNSSSGNRKGGWKAEINSAVAFKTGTKEVIKVILSDGSFFECTPDHLLALPNGTYIEAKDSEGEFLEKFYSFSNKNTNKSYRHINTISNGYNRQYRMIWQYFYGDYDGKNFNVDHIDSDSTNDSLNNLRLLDFNYHKSLADRIGENNPINKMDKDRMKYFQKYKNILGNAARYKWDDERVELELNKFYSENILPEIEDINIYLNERVYVDQIIYEGKNIEVYDLNVKNNHNFYIITKTDDERFLNSSGVLVHNCGEIPLCPEDSCRLIAINLYSYVDSKFQEFSYFDEDLFIQHVRMAQRLMDDLVDLEIEKLDRIINKIISDPEPEDIKQVELNLWRRIKQKAIDGRRTGLGITGEGDMLAALGFRYGTKEATEFSERIHSLLAINSYASSILMAEERGAFPIWNSFDEVWNPFISRVLNKLNEGIDVKSGYSNPLIWMYQTVGRRNISNLTIAPTGTTSLMTQTTSGIEPMFMPYYVRRKKLSQDVNKYDFIDSVGDKWEEFKVYHHPFIEWYRTQLENHIDDFHVWYDGLDYSNEEIERFFNNISKELFDSIFELSPYYKATSNDVDYFEKVRMQGCIQKWVDHSISVTINMPNNVSKDVVGECYMLAHQVGCKGMTVYRDGSRSGVLVKEEKKEEKVEIKYNNAVKRPEVVECDIYRKTVLKKDWMIIVGLLNGKPLEIFAFEDKDLNFPKHLHKGKVRKIKSRVYELIGEDLGKTFIIPDIVNLIHIDDKSDTRKYSLMLRHGIHPKFIIQQIDEYATVVSFDKAIQRVLKNYVDLNGLKGNPCPNCGLELMRVEGCEKCTCGYSRC